jgi:hypothetical protein
MSLFDVIGCRAMRSLFDIRRCRYCSLMVVISNMHCVDSREGDESARAEAGRVGAESASLPVTGVKVGARPKITARNMQLPSLAIQLIIKVGGIGSSCQTDLI